MMTEPIPKLKTILWRGWRRRCPHCGQGPIYKGWLEMHERCSHCDFKYLQDQGDLWAYLVVIDRAVFLFPLVVLISWWFYFSSASVFFGLIYTFPHRNGMGLGCDYYFRRKWGDLAPPDDAAKPGGSPKS